MSLPSAVRRLHCLGHRHSLWHREADGRVDVDAMIRTLFDGLDTGFGDRHLDLHVGRQRVEVARLGNDRLPVTVEHRVGLNGEAALASRVTLPGGLQEGGPTRRHLFDEPPGNLRLAPGWIFGDDLMDTVAPEVHFLLEHSEDNLRVGRGAHGAVADGIGQLVK